MMSLIKIYTILLIAIQPILATSHAETHSKLKKKSKY